jgi:hypothetical protein
MTVVRSSNTYAFLTTVLVLVLSVLACRQPLPSKPTTVAVVTTVTTVTPDNTLDNTSEWMAVVARPVVNVRTKPDGNVISQLRAGVSVEIRECTRTWCRIANPAGWVWRGCLSDNQNNLGCRAK